MGDEDALIDLLKKINENLEELGKKLDRIIEIQESSKPIAKAITSGEMPLDVDTLLSLPDHLRKTAMAICALGEATAAQVAAETSRARAAESDYLNQLVSLGLLKKKRKGRDVYFYIEK
ncbi:MAG: helix-turn-helix domain-containing protein [Candidatus Bathyarchaeia archaeon]